MQYPNIAQPQYGFGPTMPMMPSMSDMPPAMMAKGGAVAAENVRSQGRGNDSMLVHMTPKEVAGLQALAMQHGGSLTINPKTGLPEAGFLDAILPIAAGFALGPAGFGLMSAPAAALTVGGVTALATGDLGRGLMAGLGAFGGANLGTALSTTGAGAETLAALPEAGATALPTAAEQSAGQSLLSKSISSTPGMTLAPGATSPYGTNLLQAAGTPTVQAAAPIITMTPSQVAAMQVQPSFSTVGSGIKDLAAPGGFGRFGTAFSNASGGTMGTTLGVTGMAAPVLNAMQPTYDFPTSTPEASNYEGPYTPTPRDVRYPTEDERRRVGTSEYMYFNPSNPVPFAEGGDVEDRSIKMPGADYVAGQKPEFSYGFKPIEVAQPVVQNIPASIGGKGGIVKKLSRMVSAHLGKENSNYTDLSGYEYDPRTQRLVKSSGVSALARGGSVPQLEDGGFVLTKKAVDGLGKGSNKKGQRVASAGLGAIPIKGAGAKRGPKAGVDDKIKTTIDGKHPARISNGEAYVPRKEVKRRGGAQKFYDLMKKAERRA